MLKDVIAAVYRKQHCTEYILIITRIRSISTLNDSSDLSSYGSHTIKLLHPKITDFVVYFWSDKQLEQILETPLHPKKVTVWCSLFAGGITGPYFFKNEVGENVTVNGTRYRNMISD